MAGYTQRPLHRPPREHTWKSLSTWEGGSLLPGRAVAWQPSSTCAGYHNKRKRGEDRPTRVPLALDVCGPGAICCNSAGARGSRGVLVRRIALSEGRRGADRVRPAGSKGPTRGGIDCLPSRSDRRESGRGGEDMPILYAAAPCGSARRVGGRRWGVKRAPPLLYSVTL